MSMWRTLYSKLSAFNLIVFPGDLPTGNYVAKVYVDGKSAGNQPFAVSLPSLAAFECPNYLCQILDIPTGNMEQLDTSLVDVYDNSCPGDGSLHKMFDTYGDDSLRKLMV